MPSPTINDVTHIVKIDIIIAEISLNDEIRLKTYETKNIATFRIFKTNYLSRSPDIREVLVLIHI